MAFSRATATRKVRDLYSLSSMDSSKQHQVVLTSRDAANCSNASGNLDRKQRLSRCSGHVI